MQIEHYVTTEGKDIFSDWFAQLRDKATKVVIERRLLRIETGNLGQVRALQKGVWEIKIDFGAGYRIYYAQSGRTVILLLCAGDKGTQDADIARAITHWEDYQQRTRSLS
jgi:putative addiction module killer protein